MFKSGYVSVVGKPNAGKSTLVNKLVGFKVAITTPKPQTTRFNIKGIVTSKSSQIVFIDTPGVHTPKHKMGKYMMENVNTAVSNVDVIVSRAGASVISEITSLGIPSILVPSPYVANNHQFYNAKELVDNKASILLEEKDFNSDNLLEKIDLLMKDKVLYNSMHEESLKLSNHQSCDLIYKEIKELIK